MQIIIGSKVSANEINLTTVFKSPGHFFGSIEGDGSVEHLVGTQKYSHWIVQTHGVSYRIDYLPGESHAIFKVSAVSIGSMIGQGRKKLPE